MIHYQVGGSLTSNAPSYVERQSDIELYEALKQGNFCYVLNSRQMGKSSLLVRTKHRLEREGFKCTAIDLTNIGSENITPLQWYKGIVAELWTGFKLLNKIHFKNWWKEQEDFSYIKILNEFIRELLEVQFPQDRLVIFIDEIDSTLSLDFPVDDFFALIRFCYNQRAINPNYKRITFAIFGVATPSDLIKDRNRTPFNIGQAIELKGFDLQSAGSLAEGLNIKGGNSQEVLKEILAWTGGQPFLTQKLCNLVTNFSEDRAGSQVTIPPGTEADWVEKIVRSGVIERWESQDEPEHLRTIRDRIERQGKYTGRMLGIYQQILQGFAVKTDDSREQIELLLSGLVVREQGLLDVKNRIYEEVFNLEWVEKQLAALRPYSQSLEAWVASQRTDESRLLRGIALKDALTWSLGKSLSDLDYQYLGASQALSKRETENALESVEQANYILSFTRRNTKKESLRHRIWSGWTAVTALWVASLAILLRLTGLFQGMEWDVLDQFFRLRPLESPEPRIVIVTVSETDITNIGQWPIPDRVLVQAIKNIKARNPRAIGLDLYRDLPVEKGHEALVEMFKSTPNLIGIEKVVGPRIAPPLVLSQLERIGFVDIVLDTDGQVRRGLLSVQRKQRVYRSLALQMALIYLKAEGVNGKQIDENRWQFGKAVFQPFEPNDGGYVGADAGGYQILLNFRGLLDNFPTISLNDLLNNRIAPGLIENRIILIGATAESLNDFFYTPYSKSLFGAAERTPGVVIHANLIGQILSAVLDGRPLIKVWSKPKEWFWIFLWSLIGAGLTWQLQSWRALACSILFACLGLLLIAYLAFLQGWWLPVVPPMVGLVGAAIALAILINKQLEQLQLRLIFERLLEESAVSPTASRIAIEYLKQSESDKNQALIERWMSDRR
ncbi:CHASE2 domain-containing protein [Microseira wollei]|uniref:Chase2 sensor protein n=1 Tax=Microseira wollei NIES-4236 TaxID=2530354 RepID=A0AAV3X9F1_9CYAN|nr:CHASE2 domain-containing protein [Microseira wollei]GET37936.1 putative Chase2 sensor protein [Microseira wollei NIES-4236]